MSEGKKKEEEYEAEYWWVKSTTHLGAQLVVEFRKCLVLTITGWVCDQGLSLSCAFPRDTLLDPIVKGLSGTYIQQPTRMPPADAWSWGNDL